MITVQHIFGCAGCGAVKIETYVYYSLSDEPLRPSLPDGWRYVGYRLLCASHRVEMTVDGTAVSIA